MKVAVPPGSEGRRAERSAGALAWRRWPAGRPRLLCALLGSAALAAPAAAATSIARNIDRDPATEHIVRTRVRLPYFATPIVGRVWMVVDFVGGKRIKGVLGPSGEDLQPPRFADRNGDGLPDMFIQAQAGNSLFFAEIWQWNGTRARRLWAPSAAALRLLERRTGFVANGPIATEFPDDDGDGVRDIVETFTIGQCRACPPVEKVGLHYRYRPARGIWTFLGFEDL
jgi:hypothetical protein